MDETEDVWRERDDLPRFASGDQDYDSARGWNQDVDIEKMVRDAKKRDPRAWAKAPKMLETHPVAEWLGYADRRSPTEQMFGPFWRQREVAVLFGTTGTGKSALAAQIGESLARGRTIAPFSDSEGHSVGPQRVLYVDFELQVDQFAMRYVRTGEDGKPTRDYYEFSPDMIRCELAWDGAVIEGYDGFSDMFFTALINAINAYRSTVVIVDNITFLDRSSTSNANAALMIMRALQQLKRQADVSVLVLAHTSKRSPWMPVTELDLQGSINLANFADSIFAVARSRQSLDLRYLKQIKVRSGRPEMTTGRVPVFALERYDFAAAQGRGSGVESKDFLGLRFVEFAPEDEHLEDDARLNTDKSRRSKHHASIAAKAKNLAAQGKIIADIATELAIPKSTAHRYVKAV
ncbi:MAG: AAA family ATPase [Acidobacteriota bacterium]